MYVTHRLTDLLALLHGAGIEYRTWNEGNMYGALMNQDRRLMVRLLGNAAVTAFCLAWVIETFLYIQKEMAASFAAKITKNMQDRYVRGDMYYRLISIDGRIKDADQRLAEDIREFGDSFTDLAIWGLRPAINVVFLTLRMGFFLSWKFPAALFAYFGMATLTLKLAAPNYRSLWRELSRLEVNSVP